MRKWHVSFVLGVSLFLLCWRATPGSQVQLFDSKKSQQELEIMKGILRTTLEFAAKEVQGGSDDNKPVRFEFGTFSNITAFYLYGQGAVFSIPTSSLRHSFEFHWEGLKGPLAGLQGSAAAIAGPEDINIELSNVDSQIQNEIERAHEEVERAQEQVQRVREEMERAREREQDIDVPNLAPPPAPATPTTPSAPPVPSAPGASPKQPQLVPPVAPARPKRPHIVAPTSGLTPERREQLRKRLAEAQERVKKRQEELERSQEKFQEQFAEIKVYLIEALANHGDSLSIVKPNEYVTLLISDDSGQEFFSHRSPGRREVISVQKSTIADYKAGRINLETFKQKVLDYSN